MSVVVSLWHVGGGGGEPTVIGTLQTVQVYSPESPLSDAELVGICGSVMLRHISPSPVISNLQ